MEQISAVTGKPIPLPSGEHPWAHALRRQRKLLSRADRLIIIALTLYLLSGPAISWARTVMAYLPSPWLRALAFCGWLAALFGVAGLPLGFVRGFIVEKRFGLSTQTLGGWVSDHLKGALLGIVLGAIIVSGLTATLLWGGTNWWWLAAIGAALFGVLLTRLAPQLILPLFFKLKPLDSPELQTRFKRLANDTRTPVLGVFEIDLSRRTRTANAAVIGFGGSRKAVVGDTLLAEFSLDEAEFVLAHELGHHRYHDLWTGIGLGSVLTLATLTLTHIIMMEFSALMAVTFPPTPADFNPIIYLWIAIVMSLLQALLGPVSKAYSRYVEARADRFAATATRNAPAGARAFRKLGYQNLAVFKPPRWEELLFYTHPAIFRRINRLDNC